MSRGPTRHKEDLDALPKEDSFVFQDHLPAVSGGLVRYWKDRGLVQAVTGSETSSDELDCLNRLIEEARQFERMERQAALPLDVVEVE